MTQQANTIEVTFDGKTHTFELTLGEIELLEDAFDRSIDQIDTSRTKAAIYLVAFAQHREQRNRSLDDILAEVRGRGIDSLAVKEEEPAAKPRPTRAKAA